MPVKLNFQLSKKNKIIIGIVSTFIVIGLFIFAYYYFFHAFTDKNPRFTLRKIEVISPEGWLNGREDVMQSMLLSMGYKKTKNKYNLFQFDLAHIRKELLKNPGIKSVSVFRKLPDTLVVRIVERFPCAILGNRNSPFLVDHDGVVISRRNVKAYVNQLPLITTPVPFPVFGRKFHDVMPAVNLIRLSQTAYPAVKFFHFSFSGNNLRAFLFMNRNKSDVYVVDMLADEKPVKNMDRIITTIRDLKRKGNTTGRIIDIRFKNQSVIKTVPQPAAKQTQKHINKNTKKK